MTLGRGGEGGRGWATNGRLAAAAGGRAAGSALMGADALSSPPFGGCTCEQHISGAREMEKMWRREDSFSLSVFLLRQSRPVKSKRIGQRGAWFSW